MEANNSWGVSNMDGRGMVGTIYVGDYKTMLQTNYISCWPHGFREGNLVFPIKNVRKLMVIGA